MADYSKRPSLALEDQIVGRFYILNFIPNSDTTTNTTPSSVQDLPPQSLEESLSNQATSSTVRIGLLANKEDNCGTYFLSEGSGDDSGKWFRTWRRYGNSSMKPKYYCLGWVWTNPKDVFFEKDPRIQAPILCYTHHQKLEAVVEGPGNANKDAEFGDAEPKEELPGAQPIECCNLQELLEEQSWFLQKLQAMRDARSGGSEDEWEGESGDSEDGSLDDDSESEEYSDEEDGSFGDESEEESGEPGQDEEGSSEDEPQEEFGNQNEDTSGTQGTYS